MLIDLKRKFYTLIRDLGYNITDSGDYVEQFPWLMLRLTNSQLLQSIDTTINRVVLTLDIFSTYSGEKEILEIVENINNQLQNFQNENPEILFAYQKMFKTLDDKATGPVRKHGIVNYEFILGQGLIPEEEEPEDEAN
jgi:hypothetical protein